MKKLVIAGGSGFLGKTLAKHFLGKGVEVINLSRGDAGERQGVKNLKWDGETVGNWVEALEGADALINLSGRTVNCRYNERNKRQIYDSRLKSTAVLGEALKLVGKKPEVWLNASSATIYAHSNGESNDENGKIGSGFSVDVCQKWEKAFFDAEVDGVRKVCLRTAMVIGENGPFLNLMTKIVRLRLGGRQGSGEQFVSWLHEKDFIGAVEFLINNTSMKGVYNLAAPNPLKNEEMMAALRRVCKIKIGLPALPFMVHLGALFMRTEAELPLKSRNVIPGRLLEAGYQFKFSEMEPALEDLVNDSR